jgi:hypothetical protein
MRLRLPVGFRLPYFATLALFYLYPLALRPWAGDPNCAIVKWGMFAFSAIAGAVFLTLLPTIRRGADYVADNGSPWTWPWYPWVLFGTLGLGICFRAYYLCISFHAVVGSGTIFGPYFLVPFLWVVACLLLEMGIVLRRAPTQVLSSLLCLGLIPMALTAAPSEAQDMGFLALFHNTLGSSPLFLTLVAATFFHLLAVLRKANAASLGFVLTVAAFVICGPSTFNPSTTCGPYGLPILLLGILFVVAAIRKRSARECLAGAWCVVFMLWIDCREMTFAAYHGAIPIHLLVACTLTVGALFHDAAGRAIQNLGAIALFFLALIAALCPPRSLGNPPEALLTLYPLSITIIAGVYGFANKNSWYYASAVGSLCGWLAVPGWNIFCRARRSLAGMDYIVCGVASFLVAFVVSLVKMGFFRRYYRHRRGKE